jgi:WD40 repeat protein
LHVLDPATLRPDTEAIELPHPIAAVSPGPDEHHAFVLYLTAADRWWQRATTGDWALVDLDNGDVVRGGLLAVETGLEAAFSPRGDQVTITGDAGESVLLDTRTGEQTALPSGADRGLVFGATYNADGSLVATGTSQQTARLWDASTGELVGEVRVPSGSVHVGFRDDGTLLVASGDGPVYAWDTSPRYALAWSWRTAR